MSKDQEEQIPMDYALENAYQQAKELRAQYPASKDGSEDRLERHAAFTIARLAGKLRLEAGFRKALEDIATFFEHDTWGGQIGFDMRQIARDALETGDPNVARWPHSSEIDWMAEDE